MVQTPFTTSRFVSQNDRRCYRSALPDSSTHWTVVQRSPTNSQSQMLGPVPYTSNGLQTRVLRITSDPIVAHRITTESTIQGLCPMIIREGATRHAVFPGHCRCLPE